MHAWAQCKFKLSLTLLCGNLKIWKTAYESILTVSNHHCVWESSALYMQVTNTACSRWQNYYTYREPFAYCARRRGIVLAALLTWTREFILFVSCNCLTRNIMLFMIEYGTLKPCCLPGVFNIAAWCPATQCNRMYGSNICGVTSILPLPVLVYQLSNNKLTLSRKCCLEFIYLLWDI